MLLGSSAKQIPEQFYIHLFAAGALLCERGHWQAQNVRDPFWRFYWNLDEGAFVTLGDGSCFLIPAQQCCLIPSGVHFSCGQSAAFRHFYVHFDVLGLPMLAQRRLFDAPRAFVPHPQESEELFALAQSVAVLDKDTKAPLSLSAAIQAKVIILRTLGAALVQCQGTLSTAPGEFPGLVALLEWIESNLENPLSVSQLAERCHLSPDYFSRCFKRSLGQSVSDYIRERRIARAAQRLLFSHESIEQIARDCGFTNRFYFSRVFTGRMGMPPAAYRKQIPA